MVFEDVIGQSHVTETLRNAITSHRVAHAYIFSGTRGCGKTTTARILARALNCLKPVNANPDNACSHCLDIIAGKSLDVVEIDGASNRGVEEIRNLRESVRYAPINGKFKVYIIDEVHMLTKEAFNALLKTLEEPPQHVVFVFATTEAHKVPQTILSRCQRFDFRRIGMDEIVASLRFIAKEENVGIDDDTLAIIAKKGDGSLRDAQSIFDQVRSFCGNDIKAAEVIKVLNVVDQELYFRLSDIVHDHNAKAGIELIDEVSGKGYDLREFVSGLAEHFRNLLVVQSTDSTRLVETSEPFKRRYQSEARRFSEVDILRLIKQTTDLEQGIRWAPQPRFKLEAAILQMVKMEDAVQIGELLAELGELKKKLTPAHPAIDGLRVPKIENIENIKLVGAVQAGPLRSPSVMSYASYAATSQSIPFVTPRAAVKSADRLESRAPGALNKDTVVHRWPDFVQDVTKNRIAVGTTLSESRLLDLSEGFVRIGCPDDYHLSTLKRNKDFLAESFHRITGSRISIEPVLHKEPSSATETARATVNIPAPQQDLPAPSGRAEEHPVVRALIKVLGAEKVE